MKTSLRDDVCAYFDWEAKNNGLLDIQIAFNPDNDGVTADAVWHELADCLTAQDIPNPKYLWTPESL